MQKYSILFILLITLYSCKQSNPEDVLQRIGEEVNFSGYMWDIKHTEYKVGPGPNYFSRYYDDVYVDALGYLHMKIAQHDEKWYSTEVVGRDKVGYGIYTWVLQGDLENIPENITVGLFSWDTESFYTQANSEVDIEFSKWGDPDLKTTLHYSVQPVAFGPTYSERTYNAITQKDELVGVTTHQFIWTDSLIEWSSYKGENLNEANRIAFWTFNLDNPARIKYENGESSVPIIIPGPGETTNVRINFWLLPWVNLAPTDGLTQEIVIRSFSYTAL